MAERTPGWVRTFRQVVKWVAIGVLGFATLIFLYVVVVLLGAALGLWPLDTR